MEYKYGIQIWNTSIEYQYRTSREYKYEIQEWKMNMEYHYRTSREQGIQEQSKQHIQYGIRVWNTIWNIQKWNLSIDQVGNTIWNTSMEYKNAMQEWNTNVESKYATQ